MNASSIFSLCFAIAGVTHALPAEIAFQDAIESYSKLRTETTAKVQEIENANRQLIEEFDLAMLQLDTELKACPDFECADLVNQKRTKTRNTFDSHSRQQMNQIIKIPELATSSAFDIAVGSFVYETSKLLREDDRLVGFKQTPIKLCESPYRNLYFFDSISLGRCMESIIDFKSNRSFFRIKLSVGLGSNSSTVPIPPPGRGDVFIRPDDV